MDPFYYNSNYAVWFHGRDQLNVSQLSTETQSYLNLSAVLMVMIQGLFASQTEKSVYSYYIGFKDGLYVMYPSSVYSDIFLYF